MTNNENSDHYVIYELEHIIASRTYGSKHRHVHVRNISFFSTLESAEAAMRLYIIDEKKSLGEEEYRHYCKAYQIVERKVYNHPTKEADIFNPWRSYTADGEMCQDHMS